MDILDDDIRSFDTLSIATLEEILGENNSTLSVLSDVTTDDTIESSSNELAKQIQHDYDTKASNNTKLSRCIVTIFTPDKDECWLKPLTYLPNDLHRIQVWAGQFEICPTTNALHAHIYIEFVTRLRPRFKMIREAFVKYVNRVNICRAKKPSKKQRQGAVNYCLDPNKRAPETEAYIHETDIVVGFDPTFVTTTDKDKAKEDEQRRKYIESKPRFWTWDQIVHESEQSKKLLYACSWGDKYHKGRHASDKRRTIENIVILYGAGGTGKSTMAHDYDRKDNEFDDERYYRRNPDDGAFWGGGRTSYKGQRIVHYEEFTGQEAFSRLKEVCDIGKTGPSVNVKNGGTFLNHETVIFTSNVHPAGWFHNLWKQDPKQFHPFWRRVTKILFFPSHRSDGSLSIPDNEHAPFFHDQTNEWKLLQGDYNEALKHADTHWPLKDEPDGPMLIVPGTKTGDPPFIQYCKTGKMP